MRYGWTIPKFVGNAVARNRFKRWCREYVRCNQPDFLDKSMDVNFVLRKQSKEFYKNLDHKSFDQSISQAYTLLKKKDGKSA